MFAIHDLVDVKDREQLPVYGKIVELQGEKAVVNFKIPRQPKTCSGCGWPFNLSINGNTGEIECMRSGCGHRHGFEDRTEIIPLSQLINISAQRSAEKKRKMVEDLKGTILKIRSELAVAEKEKLFTNDEKTKLLKALDVLEGRVPE